MASASPTQCLMVLENNVQLEFSFLEAPGLWIQVLAFSGLLKPSNVSRKTPEL